LPASCTFSPQRVDVHDTYIVELDYSDVPAWEPYYDAMQQRIDELDAQARMN
jgi:hypothetical protein